MNADLFEPLFPSAMEAIRFAVTRDGTPPRPASSRMLDTVSGRRAFTVVDAAAQAGMILNIVEALGRMPVATLIASAAPRTLRCTCRRPCCSGRMANRYWREAVDTISQEAVRALPPGSKRSYALRSAIVVKIYGGKGNFKDIAAELSIDQETVSRQHRAIIRWLRGGKAGKHGEAVEGIEPGAWAEAETMLRNHGIVG